MTRRLWTKQEDEFIKANYLIKSSQEISDNLPGRTLKSVIHRIEKLNLTGQRNSARFERKKDVFDEKLSKSLGKPLDEWLRQRYIVEKATYRELCAELGINTRTLIRRMREFGIEPIDHKTAGKRNYEKHKKVYLESMNLRNNDESRQKNALTRQNNWGNFSSDPAKALKKALNDEGLQPIPEYAVFRFNIDLAFPYTMLAVEVDGGNWHQSKHHLKVQEKKEAYLKENGWTILRVKTTEPMIQNVAKVSSVIMSLASTQPR